MSAKAKLSRNNGVDYLTRDDSLEYFIKFPAPSMSTQMYPYPNQSPSNGYADYNYDIIYDNVNTPIVLLLGWAGCQDRYLMKYSKIYEDRG